MDNILILLSVFVAGLLLGAFFFGGLWWTTKKALVSGAPMLWFFSSLIVRFGITLVVLYYISRNHWERMLICLLGFIIARIIIVRITKNQAQTKSIVKEVKYENES
jgi:F1F0 ATPase subunit 2